MIRNTTPPTKVGEKRPSDNRPLPLPPYGFRYGEYREILPGERYLCPSCMSIKVMTLERHESGVVFRGVVLDPDCSGGFGSIPNATRVEMEIESELSEILYEIHQIERSLS